MSAPDLGFLDAAAASRREVDRRRRRAATGVSVAVTLLWLVGVVVSGAWERVWDHWVAAPTMLFGSFVAGSTPQGGGAVAFPVFTKALDVPSEVARTFSLAIQTVGMGTASLAIFIRRRPVSLPAVAWSLPAALVGFFAALHLLGDPDGLFWPSRLPGAYVKVSFSLLVVAMAFVVWLGSRVPVREVRSTIAPLGGRQVAILVVGGLVGGVASAQVGSGVDVLLYLAAVVVLGLEPRIAVPSSVLVMTGVSVVGFAYLGFVHGQFDLVLGEGTVTRVGEMVPAEPLPASRYDVVGLWLAAVPVVCWGAPLGSAFAARISTRQLAAFVAVLAALEAVTTVAFLPELHTDAGLVAYAVGGLVGLILLLTACARLRHRIADVRVDPDRSLSREAVDVGPGYATPGPTSPSNDKEPDA